MHVSEGLITLTLDYELINQSFQQNNWRCCMLSKECFNT